MIVETCVVVFDDEVIQVEIQNIQTFLQFELGLQI